MTGILGGIEPDYAFYTTSYHGTMDEASFMAALSDAVAEVSYAVWPGANLSPYETRVKMAVCAVADAVGNPERRRTSYTAGKVSESYGDAGFSLTAEAGIRRWLSGIGILKWGRWL